MFAGGNPVLLGARVDLEDVGPRTEDGLLAVQRGGGGNRGGKKKMEMGESGSA